MNPTKHVSAHAQVVIDAIAKAKADPASVVFPQHTPEVLVLDSKDDDDFMELVPPQQSDPKFFEEYRAFAFSAAATKNKEALLSLLQGPSAQFDRLAMKHILALCSDDELFALAAAGTTSIKHTFAYMCIAQRRTALLKRFLDHMEAQVGHEWIVAFVHGCAAEDIRAYVARSEIAKHHKLNWATIARTNGSIFMDLLEASLKEAPFRRRQIWGYYAQLLRKGNVIKKLLLQEHSRVMDILERYPMMKWRNPTLHSPSDFSEMLNLKNATRQLPGPVAVIFNTLFKNYPARVIEYCKGCVLFNGQLEFMDVPTEFWTLKRVRDPKAWKLLEDFIVEFIIIDCCGTRAQQPHIVSSYLRSLLSQISNLFHTQSTANIQSLLSRVLTFILDFRTKEFPVAPTGNREAVWTSLVDQVLHFFGPLNARLPIALQIPRRRYYAGARALLADEDVQVHPLTPLPLQESPQATAILGLIKTLVTFKCQVTFSMFQSECKKQAETKEVIYERLGSNCLDYFSHRITTAGKSVAMKMFLEEMLRPSLAMMKGDVRPLRLISYCEAVFLFIDPDDNMLPSQRLIHESVRADVWALARPFFCDEKRGSTKDSFPSFVLKWMPRLRPAEIAAFIGDSLPHNVLLHQLRTSSQLLTALFKSPGLSAKMDISALCEQLLDAPDLSHDNKDMLQSFRRVADKDVFITLKREADSNNPLQRGQAMVHLLEASFHSRNAVIFNKALGFVAKRLCNEVHEVRARTLSSFLEAIRFNVTVVDPAQLFAAQDEIMTMLVSDETTQSLWLVMLQHALDSADLHDSEGEDYSQRSHSSHPILSSFYFVSMYALRLAMRTQSKKLVAFGITLQWRMVDAKLGTKKACHQFKMEYPDQFELNHLHPTTEKLWDVAPVQCLHTHVPSIAHAVAYHEAVFDWYLETVTTRNSGFLTTVQADYRDDLACFVVNNAIVTLGHEALNMPRVASYLQACIEHIKNHAVRDKEGNFLLERNENLNTYLHPGLQLFQNLVASYDHLGSHEQLSWQVQPIMVAFYDIVIHSRQALAYFNQWVSLQQNQYQLSKYVWSSHPLRRRVKRREIVYKLLSISPSAIHLRMVWSYLADFDQAALTPFLKNRSPFYGVFSPDARHESDPARQLAWEDKQLQGFKEDALETGVDDFDEYWTLPSWHALYKLSQEQSCLFAARLRVIAENRSRSSASREAALRRYTLLPSISYADVYRLLQANTDHKALEARKRKSRKEFEAEAANTPNDHLLCEVKEDSAASSSMKKPFPKRLRTALVRGITKNNEPLAPLNLLLSRAFLSGPELEARTAVYAVSSLVGRMPEAVTSKLLAGLLTKRKRYLKVTVLKEVIRLIASIPSTENVSILKQQLTKKTHRDVQIVAVHACIELLQNPKVDHSICWEVVNLALHADLKETRVSLLAASPCLPVQETRKGEATKVARQFRQTQNIAHNSRVGAFLEERTQTPVAAGAVARYSKVMMALAKDDDGDIRHLAIASLIDWLTPENVNAAADLFAQELVKSSGAVLDNKSKAKQDVYNARWTAALQHALLVAGISPLVLGRPSASTQLIVSDPGAYVQRIFNELCAAIAAKRLAGTDGERGERKVLKWRLRALITALPSMDNIEVCKMYDCANEEAWLAPVLAQPNLAPLVHCRHMQQLSPLRMIFQEQPSSWATALYAYVEQLIETDQLHQIQIGELSGVISRAGAFPLFRLDVAALINRLATNAMASSSPHLAALVSTLLRSISWFYDAPCVVGFVSDGKEGLDDDDDTYDDSFPVAWREKMCIEFYNFLMDRRIECKYAAHCPFPSPWLLMEHWLNAWNTMYQQLRGSVNGSMEFITPASKRLIQETMSRALTWDGTDSPSQHVSRGAFDMITGQFPHGSAFVWLSCSQTDIVALSRMVILSGSSDIVSLSRMVTLNRSSGFVDRMLTFLNRSPDAKTSYDVQSVRVPQPKAVAFLTALCFPETIDAALMEEPHWVKFVCNLFGNGKLSVVVRAIPLPRLAALLVASIRTDLAWTPMSHLDALGQVLWQRIQSMYTPVLFVPQESTSGSRQIDQVTLRSIFDILAMLKTSAADDQRVSKVVQMGTVTLLSELGRLTAVTRKRGDDVLVCWRQEFRAPVQEYLFQFEQLQQYSQDVLASIQFEKAQ